MTESDLNKHTAVVHKPENQCTFCGYGFSCRNKLQQHIVSTHYDYPCYYCGAGYPTQRQLYEHQTKHCKNSFKCKHCDETYDDLISCQRHELQTHGRYGMSMEALPTLSAIHMFTNYMKHETQPWTFDVDKIISKQPYYFDAVMRTINSTSATLRGRGIDVDDEQLRNHIIENSVKAVRSSTIDGIRKAYLDHASEMMTHSQRNEDRDLYSYNIHLISQIPFEEQIAEILNSVYKENENNLPYKMSLMFAFMLFTPSTGRVGYWHANSHLSHDNRSNDKDLLQQRDNVWYISNEADINKCISDVQNNDFFTLMRNQFDDSNSIILRCTNVRIQIFPTADNGLGRGSDDNDDDDDDDNSDDDDQEEEQEDEGGEHDDMINDDHDDFNDSYDDDEADENSRDVIAGGQEGESEEERSKRVIKRYLAKKSRNSRYLWSNLSKLGSHHHSGDSKCFFHCLSVRELLYESDFTISQFFAMDRTQAIKQKAKELFDTYVNTFNLQSVDKALFNGVHLSIIPQLEHLYGYRINVYTIESIYNPELKTNTIKFDIAASSKSRFVYNTKKRMELIFYDNHYYLILDKDAILNDRFMCFKCGHEFTRLASLQRHIRNSCELIKPKEQYASGAVCSSKLLLEQIKEIFEVPDEILQRLNYSTEPHETGMLSKEGNDQYFTSRFATYDFESKLSSTTVKEIRERRLNYIEETYGDVETLNDYQIAQDMEEDAIEDYLNNQFVYDDEGNSITGREFREIYPDEECVLENIPVSYVIAFNFGLENIEEYAVIEPFESSDRCKVEDGIVTLTRSNKNAKELIASFYQDIKDICKKYRAENLICYEELLNYIKEWFDERGLVLNINLEDQAGEDDDIIFNDDLELVNNGDNSSSSIKKMEIVYPKDNPSAMSDGSTTLTIEDLSHDGKTIMKTLSEEIKLMRDFKRFLEMLVMVGYNSGKYDIPLIKSYLFHEIFVVDGHPTSKDHFHMIKKGPSYIGVQVTNMTTPGCYGFVLKDMREFTGPGGNLRSFMSAFAPVDTNNNEEEQTEEQRILKGKFIFPFEFLRSYEILEETLELVSKKWFFSKLKDENMLDEEMNDYIRKNNLFHLSQEELLNRSDRPISGDEYYDLIKRVWNQKGWNNMLDYLLFYNEMDVRPFLTSIMVYLKALFQHKVNPLFSCYSLPGVAKKILSSYMPPGTIYHIDNEEVFKLLRKAEVGGQSIVMTRENPPTHPFIVGYDACSLYLSSFAKNHFVGRPSLYTKFNVACPLMKLNEIQPTNKWNKRKKDGIQQRRKQSSRIANEYFDTIQKIDYPHKLIVREWRFQLSENERKYIKQRYESLNIPLNPPFSYLVDGYLHQEKVIFEFDGCYYHACNKTNYCTNNTKKNKYYRYVKTSKKENNKKIFVIERVQLTSAQIHALDEVRDEILSARGFTISRMAECQWNNVRKHNSNYKKCIKQSVDYAEKMIMWNDNHSVVTVNFTLNQILKNEVDGIAFVDIHTPDNLKERFTQFAPIIKHGYVKMKDIGPYMQEVAAKLGVKFNSEGRRMVIDSYFGENIGLTCDSIRQLVSMGLKVTDIHTFIRYDSFPIFKPFVDKITRLRMQGDSDPNKSIIATMAKLLGNSAFGSCITNVEKHREIRIAISQPRGCKSISKRQLIKEIASRHKFKGYEVVTPNILEISNEKDVIMYTQLRQISNVIFDGSKNTMRMFIDFCFTVLEKGSYHFMSTDTDSIYIAFKNGPTFEDNIDPGMRRYYEQEKHKYFVTPRAEYGERTPGLFKIEATGTNMVALCAKSYVVYNEAKEFENDKIKFSCKGVQKNEMYKSANKLRDQNHDDDDDENDDEDKTNDNAYKNLFNIYRNDLHTNKTHMIRNRGMKRTNDVFTTYEQEKKCSTSFYCKRLVLDDGVHTVPLNI